MREHDAMDDETLRQRLRQFLADHYPPELRQPLTLRLRRETLNDWLRTLLRHGWRAPGWPREHGGMGLSVRQQAIYHEEMELYQVARIHDGGETLLGPVLMQFGTEAQKRYYLPRILACDDMWAQGYSEPNAGSDLASLRTTAVADGDGFVVNGQKTWCTHAPEATHLFALARTATLAKKQQGISFILIDLRTPGVTVRPIVNLIGENEFAEIFFDDVRVPNDNLVGALHDGWTVAKALLGFERMYVGNPILARHSYATLLRFCDANSLRHHPMFADRLARAGADLADTESLFREVREAWIVGQAPHSETSMLKLLSTELFQRISELLIDVAQEHGGVAGDIEVAGMSLNPGLIHLIARPPTIFAGASEVQRNILAKAVLG